MNMPLARLKVMKTSKPAPETFEYWVVVEKDDKTLETNYYHIKGRALHEIDEWNWLFGHIEKKPCILDYDVYG